jgi:hypothetical protein
VVGQKGNERVDKRKKRGRKMQKKRRSVVNKNEQEKLEEKEVCEEQ